MNQTLTDKSLKSFFASPCEQSFRTLQDEAIQSSGFEPRAFAVLAIERAFRQGESPTRLLCEIEQLPWSTNLCPRRHFIEAQLRESLGELQQMQQSVDAMQSCLKAILDSGRGTRNAPYFPTFSIDSRDILQVIGERVRSQVLVNDKPRVFDVVTGHSGEDVWFDVTRLIAATS